MRPRRVRRHRRPGPQEADPGDLRPGQPRPAAARLRPARLRPPRLGRRRLRRARPHAAKEHARTPFREEVWQRLADSIRFVPGPSTTTTLSTSWPEAAPISTTATASAATPRSTSPSRRRASRRCSSRWSAPAWPTQRPGRRLAPGRRREALRPRPEVAPASSTRWSTPSSPPTVFRIDHYLGKETVQNLLALRFANTLFEPIWNRHYVDSVQITMAEDVGIGSRAGFYDGTGAARDVLQNHLLQLLALTAMEEPVSFDADALRAEKVKVLSGDPAARRPRARRDPRPVRAGLAGRPAGRRLPGRGRHPDGLDDRDLRGGAAGRRDPALGGRPVLPAHRQAAAPAGHRDRGVVQARAAPAVRGHRHQRARARTSSSCGCSPTRASPCASAPRCPARSMEVRDVSWTSSTARPSPRALPRPTSG